MYIIIDFTCQVNASPLAFSDSNSLDDLGKEFLHNKSIRGRSPRTTLTPNYRHIIYQQNLFSFFHNYGLVIT